MLGGNQRARQFFKQHGWYELGADKIESKYTSRAAVLYKAALEKDLHRVNSNLAALPSSPTAAQATKQGLDLLAATVRGFLYSAAKAGHHSGTTANPRAERACGVPPKKTTAVARIALGVQQLHLHAQPSLHSCFALLESNGNAHGGHQRTDTKSASACKAG